MGAWTDGTRTRILRTLQRAGLDLDELENAINREPERFESALEENTEGSEQRVIGAPDHGV